MEPLDSLDGHEGVVYCVAWGPRGSQQLLSATSKGEIFLWDTSKRQILNKWANHKDAVYRVSWNFNQPNLFATCSKDGHW